MTRSWPTSGPTTDPAGPCSSWPPPRRSSPSPENSPAFDSPHDLRDAQLALHQTRAAYEEYAKTLPWSAEPMPGWEGDKRLHSSYRSHMDDSPGYTEEQTTDSPALPG
ncbi:hypothetical protein GCM10010207_83890 [Streptomyces atratus]|nr:hypothetical protein GCM10010207_83890 [Streptomyces atratus]